MITFNKLKKTLSVFIAATSVYAQAYENFIQYEVINGIEFGIYQPNLDQEEIVSFYKNQDGEHYITLQDAIKAQQQNNTDILFLMNGGIYTDQYHPGGLYIENHQLIQKINLNKGRDNFHTQPNGVFYMQHGKPYIVKSQDFTYDETISTAIQSGPLLMNNGKIYSHFTNKSTSKYVRNAVCIDKDQQVYFAQSFNPSNMYQFAKALKDRLSCDTLLYLDGFLSNMIDKKGQKEEQIRPFVTMIGTKPKQSID